MKSIAQARLAESQLYIKRLESTDPRAKYVVLRGYDSTRVFDGSFLYFVEPVYFQNKRTALAYAKAKSDAYDCVCSVWTVPKLVQSVDAR